MPIHAPSNREVMQKCKKYTPSNNHAKSEGIDGYPGANIDYRIHSGGNR